MQVKNICTLTNKETILYSKNMGTLHKNHILAEKKKTNKKKRNDAAILKHTKVQIVSIYKKNGKKKD